MAKTVPALDQITTHFRVSEFDCHDGTPVPRPSHAALERLCVQYLEPLRERFGACTVLSGFRHKAYNAKVGGGEKGIHCYELHPKAVAADVRFADGTPEEWAALAADVLAAPGVGRFDQSRYVHVDTRRSGTLRWTGRMEPPPRVAAAPMRKALDRISPHFRVAEFNCHDGTPVPAGAHDAVRRLCEDYLEPMRERFGAARVLSGFRHRAYNDRIGGAKQSMHVYEEHLDQVAADLQFARGTPADWSAFADSLGAPGVGRYDDSVFSHLDNRTSGRARWTGSQG